MIMCAKVLEVNNDNLLVHDNSTEQDVVVNTSCTCRFNVDDHVKIIYNGAMTNSLPPQISPQKICKINCR
ncbi:MAG: hypothetical protein K2K02_06495 [Ruminococcus sp.]|nr:hypothetical protein [Ruminococcus sp.]